MCVAVLWQKTPLPLFIHFFLRRVASLSHSSFMYPNWSVTCLPASCFSSTCVLQLVKESNLLLGLTLAYNVHHLTFHRWFISFLCPSTIEPIAYLVALTGKYSSKVMIHAPIMYFGRCRVTSASIVWGVSLPVEQHCRHDARDNSSNLAVLWIFL